jgi:hypothetical protein
MAIPLSPADRLAQIADLLCQVIAASIRGGVMPGSLIVLLWHRVRRAAARFAAIAARIEAGAPPSPSCLPSAAAERATPERPAVTRVPRRARLLPNGEPDRLPAWMWRRAGWLVWLVPEAAMCGGQLHALLADPAMVALASASPPLGRILRSLCWMLAVDTASLPPPRTRPPRAAPAPRPAPRSVTRPVTRSAPRSATRSVTRLAPRSATHSPPNHAPCSLFLAPRDPRPEPKRRRSRASSGPWTVSW